MNRRRTAYRSSHRRQKTLSILMPQLITVLWFCMILAGSSAFAGEPIIRLRWDWRMGAEMFLWEGSPLFLRLEIQPDSFRWKAIHFVDSIGAQLLTPTIEPVQWKGEGKQFLVFAFAPAAIAALPIGQYRIWGEVVESSGRVYRSSPLTLSVISRQPIDSLQRWRERWRIVHWLDLRGLTQQAGAVARQLLASSPVIPIRQLTEAYFDHRSVPSSAAPPSVWKVYWQEWRWRRRDGMEE